MNINCPKCGFNQPEDQYCANCGVDMANYEPPKKPMWQRVASNWIFQLSILVVIVLVLITRDIIFPPQDRTDIGQRDLPPVEQRSYRGSEGSDPYAAYRKKPVRPPTPPKNGKKVTPPGTQAKAAAEKTPKRKLKPLKKRIGAFLYLTSRDQLETLEAEGELLDDGVFAIPIRAFAKSLKTYRSDWKKLRSQGKDFEFGDPANLFFGQRSLDEGKSVGFFTRAVVSEGADPLNLNIDVRSWAELKSEGEPIDGPAVVYTLPRTHLLLLTGMAPKGVEYTEDEKKLQEGDPVLSALNDPRFTEEIADVVLVLQFK